MTMSEKIRHTAGPWEYGPARNYVGFYIAPKGTRPTLTAVERSWGSGDVINVECFNFPGETEANARLIAAAPDLLAYAECQQAFDAYYHAPEAGATEEARMIEIFAHHGIMSEPNQPRRRDALIAFGCAALAKAATARPAAPSGDERR